MNLDKKLDFGKYFASNLTNNPLNNDEFEPTNSS